MISEQFCYYCPEKTLLTDKNESCEHIIHNCIGGQLKSSNLLCNVCNGIFARTVDLEIDGQLGVFADIIGAKKDGPKKTPIITMYSKDGNIIKVGPWFKPHPKVSIIINNEERNTEVINNDDYLENLNIKTQTLSKKFKVNTTHIIDPLDEREYYLANSLKDLAGIGNMALGGEIYHRGIAKIAVNYCFHKRLEKHFCVSILNYLQSTTLPNSFVFLFMPTKDNVCKIGQKEISHILHLRGDSKNKVLYVYIELFNFENYIVLIDKDYSGPEVSDTYCYDLVTSRVIDKNVNINLSRHDFEVLPIISNFQRRFHEVRYTEFMCKVNNLSKDR